MHTIWVLTVMTTVGYTTNVSVDASARCSSECISEHSKILTIYKNKKKENTNERLVCVAAT